MKNKSFIMSLHIPDIILNPKDKYVVHYNVHIPSMPSVDIDNLNKKLSMKLFIDSDSISNDIFRIVNDAIINSGADSRIMKDKWYIKACSWVNTSLKTIDYVYFIIKFYSIGTKSYVIEFKRKHGNSNILLHIFSSSLDYLKFKKYNIEPFITTPILTPIITPTITSTSTSVPTSTPAPTLAPTLANISSLTFPIKFKKEDILPIISMIKSDITEICIEGCKMAFTICAIMGPTEDGLMDLLDTELIDTMLKCFNDNVKINTLIVSAFLELSDHSFYSKYKNIKKLIEIVTEFADSTPDYFGLHLKRISIKLIKNLNTIKIILY